MVAIVVVVIVADIGAIFLVRIELATGGYDFMCTHNAGYHLWVDHDAMLAQDT